jgi:general L-amino acid transport system substrate-binding protein
MRILLLVLLWFGTAYADTLDTVQRRGILNCGVNLALAGFSLTSSDGIWEGLDVDYCRAVAAAVLGSATKVRFVPLNAQARFTALQSGEVDVLSRNTSWTLQRDASLGLQFVAPIFYDGQGFLVPIKKNITHPTQLNKASICIQSGTTTELNIHDYFKSHRMSFHPVVFEGFEESIAAFFHDRCDAYSSDASALAIIRSKNADNPNDYKVLDTLISKEPLAPVVRSNDSKWFTINRWVLYGLIEAEERGVTSKNIAQMKNTPSNGTLDKFLGVDGVFGAALGLRDDWLYQAIHQVGNYGEIYERNIGMGSSLKLPRSFNHRANALARDGGLMYAPPLR